MTTTGCVMVLMLWNWRMQSKSQWHCRLFLWNSMNILSDESLAKLQELIVIPQRSFPCQYAFDHTSDFNNPSNIRIVKWISFVVIVAMLCDMTNDKPFCVFICAAMSHVYWCLLLWQPWSDQSYAGNVRTFQDSVAKVRTQSYLSRQHTS